MKIKLFNNKTGVMVSVSNFHIMKIGYSSGMNFVLFHVSVFNPENGNLFTIQIGKCYLEVNYKLA